MIAPEPLPAVDSRIVVQGASDLLQRLALHFYHFPEPKDPDALRLFRRQCGDTCERASRDLHRAFPQICHDMADLWSVQRSLAAAKHSLQAAIVENRLLRERLLLYQALERARVQELVEGASGTILPEPEAP